MHTRIVEVGYGPRGSSSERPRPATAGGGTGRNRLRYQSWNTAKQHTTNDNQKQQPTNNKAAATAAAASSAVADYSSRPRSKVSRHTHIYSYNTTHICYNILLIYMISQIRFRPHSLCVRHGRVQDSKTHPKNRNLDRLA